MRQITCFPHLALPSPLTAVITNIGDYVAASIVPFPHLVTHPGDYDIDRGAIRDNFTFLRLPEH